MQTEDKIHTRREETPMKHTAWYHNIDTYAPRQTFEKIISIDEMNELDRHCENRGLIPSPDEPDLVPCPCQA